MIGFIGLGARRLSKADLLEIAIWRSFLTRQRDFRGQAIPHPGNPLIPKIELLFLVRFRMSPP